jgi:hypothetical protein
MLNPELNKPEIIANDEFQIQIVDTHKTAETRASVSFSGFTCQFDRTLVSRNKSVFRPAATLLFVILPQRCLLRNHIV